MLSRRCRGVFPAALASLIAISALTAAAAPPARLASATPESSEADAVAVPEELQTPDHVSALAEDPFWAEDELESGAAVDPAELDPFETGNRAVLRFNEFFDGVFWTPLTRGYQFVAPPPVRLGVRRFFKNLSTPSIFVNDLLQGRPLDAGRAVGRFVINTTLGIGGLFDPARLAGEDWEPHHADFGQTLALVGVESGPYVIIPMFGPNTLRDSIGGVVDLAMQPLTYVLVPVQLLFAGGAYGLAIREENAMELEALRDSSVDFYASLRSAYFQNRNAQIWGDPTSTAARD